jgi:hypothetical protein
MFWTENKKFLVSLLEQALPFAAAEKVAKKNEPKIKLFKQS